MANEYVNKVVFGSSTLIDLTADTVTADKLMQGYTAHDASGAPIVGTAIGGVDIPVFEVMWSSDWSTVTTTCSETFAECYQRANSADSSAYIHEWLDDQQDPWDKTATLTATDVSSTSIRYTEFGNYGPVSDIVYHSDGTIDYVQPSSYGIELSVTQNGYYYPSGGGVYTSVNVAVPSSTPTLQAKTNISPTTSSQTITADSGYDGLSSVQINAMPSGTAGTPSATKGTVSNHAVSVTPSVTNTTGYITGGTKTGTAVSVSASELVSGTYTVSASGTHDVTNYASASVASGGATASATKGSVSNHSVTVTPSVTRTAGYVTAGTANGTAVTVSASELVSGSQTITDNGTVNVTNLASVTVDIDFVTYYVSSSEPTSSQGSDGDVWLVTT